MDCMITPTLNLHMLVSVSFPGLKSAAGPANGILHALVGPQFHGDGGEDEVVHHRTDPFPPMPMF